MGKYFCNRLKISNFAVQNRVTLQSKIAKKQIFTLLIYRRKEND